MPPIKQKTVTHPNPNNHQIVLQVQPGPKYLLNKQPVPAGQLQQKLHSVFAPRVRKVLFVKGAGQVAYGMVVHAVDAAHAAGITIVGLVPRNQSSSSSSGSSGGS